MDRASCLLTRQPPELDGKVLPVGFGVAVNPNTFENLATQVGLGGKAQVAVTACRNIPWNVPEWRSKTSSSSRRISPPARP